MRTVAVALLLACFAVPARADSDKQEAKAHFRAGDSAFKLGDFKHAIDEYEQSYKLYPSAILLFDLAQALRMDGQSERAVFTYKQFLAEANDSQKERPLREAAQKKIAELEKVLAAQRKAQTSPPSGVTTPETEAAPSAQPRQAAPRKAVTPPSATAVPAAVRVAAPVEPEGMPWYKSPLGWTLASVGLVGIAISVGLLVHGNDLNDQLASATSRAQADSLESDRDTFRTAGYASLGIGAAALVAGAIVFGVTAARRHRRHLSFVAPSVDRRTIMLTVGGSW